jgi:hypothetical protein
LKTKLEGFWKAIDALGPGGVTSGPFLEHLMKVMRNGAWSLDQVGRLPGESSVHPNGRFVPMSVDEADVIGSVSRYIASRRGTDNGPEF